MYSAHHVAWAYMEGERKFGQAARSRRRASLIRALLRRCAECSRLLVHDMATIGGASAGGRVREIPLDAIVA